MKQKIRNYLLRNIVGVIIPEDIFEMKNNLIFLGGEQISDLELRQLKAEVKALESMKLWRVLNETVRYHAVHKAVHDATEFEHVLAGKMALWVIGVFDSVVKVVKTKR